VIRLSVYVLFYNSPLDKNKKIATFLQFIHTFMSSSLSGSVFRLYSVPLLAPILSLTAAFGSIISRQWHSTSK